MSMRRAVMAFTVLAICLGHGVVGAENGVYRDRIVLGQACALTGPAAALGRGMRDGLNVYFDKVNAGGGVMGRRVELKTLDDGYEPNKTKVSTKLLIEQHKVFLLIGGVGTPTAKVAVPTCENARVPFVAPFTGAELLRSPFKKWVVNVRASYYQEMEKLAELLVDQRGLSRIACFYQDDAYGFAGLEGINRALARRDMKLVSTGAYERNTSAVVMALATIAPTSPEAIVMVGAYRPCAAFIKAAKRKEETKDAIFCNISFVGTEALRKAVGANDANCIISQVVPYPWDTSIPAVRDYHKDMKAAGKEAQIGFVSFEGYLAAKFFATVMRRIDGEPTRLKFLAAVERSGNIDLGGLTLAFGPRDHQGSDEVFLTELRDGKVVPLGS